jgi:DNA-binding transcriptional LysR family regulator
MTSTGYLRLFRDIVRQRSISGGAAVHGVSQSAASQHVQELERQLGLELLDRSTRPIALTPAGRLYLEYCRDVLRRQGELDAALEELKAEVEGAVRVASIYSVGLWQMSQLEAEFQRRYPNARLEVEYLRPEKVHEAVLSDRADLGLVSYPEASRELAVLPWREERMVVAVAPAHPLSGRAVVKAEDLDGCDFVAFDPDLPIRQAIDRFLEEQGVEVRIAMHFDNIEMVKEAVALGTAVSILPDPMLVPDMAQGRLRAIPLAARLVRPVGIVHQRRKKLQRAAKLFVQLLQEQPPAGETEGDVSP